MQDIKSKIKPIPSKLYAYQIFYEDLEKFKNFYSNISVTEFGCGGSKILDFIDPSFYQGIDLNEEKILKSKNKYSNFNYNFHLGDMLNFRSNTKTDLGLCFQTLGINLSFDKDNLLKCLYNLNDHIKKDGSILFNISNELYHKNKKNIDEFCTNNYEFNDYFFYGIFNERYNHLLTRILVRIEHFISFRSFFKKFVYIKCSKKIN